MNILPIWNSKFLVFSLGTHVSWLQVWTSPRGVLREMGIPSLVRHTVGLYWFIPGCYNVTTGDVCVNSSFNQSYI